MRYLASKDKLESGSLSVNYVYFNSINFVNNVATSIHTHKPGKPLPGPLGVEEQDEVVGLGVGLG